MTEKCCDKRCDKCHEKSCDKGCDKCHNKCCEKSCDKCRDKSCKKCCRVKQTNLVSSLLNVAKNLDPALINAWGITVLDDQLLVAVNGSGLVKYYTEGGNLIKDVNVLFNGISAAPTGIVLNHSKGFVITGSGGSASSEWITVTEDGAIYGFNHLVDANNAILRVDESNLGSKFKGVTQFDDHIYVANFTGQSVNVYDFNWDDVTSDFAFSTPNLPVGYSPFNVAAIDGKIYVAYAILNPDTGDEVDGPGLGIVSVFDTNGNFIQKLIDAGGPLNAPWAMIESPECFCNVGKCCEDKLLVGNFGDGKINVFNFNGKLLTNLKKFQCDDLIIEKLWGLVAEDGKVYFAAGPNDEGDGLVGVLKPLKK